MRLQVQHFLAEFSLDQFALVFRMQQGYVHADELRAGIARQASMAGFACKMIFVAASAAILSSRSQLQLSS